MKKAILILFIGFITIINGQIYPEQFGAIANDDVDDVQAIRTALVSGNKQVVLQNGIYIIKDTLLLNIEGQSLQISNNSRIDAFISKNKNTISICANNIHLKGGEIRIQATNYMSSAVFISGTNRGVLITDIFINGYISGNQFSAIGLKLQAGNGKRTFYTTIQNVKFYRFFKSIYFEDLKYTCNTCGINGNMLSDIVISSSAHPIVLDTNAHGNNFTNIQIQWSSKYSQSGITIAGAYNTFIGGMIWDVPKRTIAIKFESTSYGNIVLLPALNSYNIKDNSIHPYTNIPNKIK